jgi:8-oxo-dGTP diphosphatase
LNLTEQGNRRIIHVAAAILLDAERRILLAQRPEGKAMAGLWEFPGGKIEHGETPEEALVRELGEELGIETSTKDLIPATFVSHDYGHFHLVMPVFLCTVWKGTIFPAEGQEIAWVGAADLAQTPMPPADIPLALNIEKAIEYALQLR